MSGPNNLPPLREVIEAYDLRAKKSLGQNFLLDENVTDKIVRLADLSPDSHVIEIGPGPGGLTRSLLKSDIHSLTAIEFDSRAVRALEDLKTYYQARLDIIEGDALEIDLTKIANKPRSIAANLPYNIATPLLTKWLRQIFDDVEAFNSMTLMFQKEVAQRITASPGSKAYGRLSVLSQWLCDTQILYHVPPSVFIPAPKVDSCVVRFRPKNRVGPQPQFQTIENLTALAFQKRRKMIRASLKNYSYILEELGIDTTLRAENLCVSTYVDIAKNIEEKEGL